MLTAVLATALIGSVRGQTATEVCFDDWSAAAAAVKQHGLVPVDKLGAMARSQARGLLVRTELCKRGDGYVYKVVLRDKRGGLKRMTVSAKEPFKAATTNGK